MTARANTIVRMLLPVAFLLVLLLTAIPTSYAQRGSQPGAPQQPVDVPCPGQVMQGVQATGVYTAKPVDDIKINGQPAPGAIWQPGMRSYWHCHAGGQIMMVDEGVGMVQKRGERAHILRKGETEYAGPGVEHWHGAEPDQSAHFFQVSIGAPGVFWMEEVGKDDYSGNDIGINSRNEFLRTGVMKKSSQPAPAAPAQTPR